MFNTFQTQPNLAFSKLTKTPKVLEIANYLYQKCVNSCEELSSSVTYLEIEYTKFVMGINNNTVY